MEEGGHPGRLDVGDGDTIDAGSPTVDPDVVPGPGQNVAAGDMAVEGVEATGGIFLGTAVEHALKGSSLVQAVGPSMVLAVWALTRTPPHERLHR